MEWSHFLWVFDQGLSGQSVFIRLVTEQKYKATEGVSVGGLIQALRPHTQL